MPDVNDPRPGDVFRSTVNGADATVLFVDDTVRLMRFPSGHHVLDGPVMFPKNWEAPPPPKVLRTGDCYWFDGERLVPMGSLKCIKGHLSGAESPALKDHLEPGSYAIQVDPRVHATHSYTLTPIDDDDELDDDGRCDDPECCE